MHNSTAFLDAFFSQIAQSGLDISNLILDHIAYQASSAQDYDQRKREFQQIGQEISEEPIGGRRVAVFQLQEPIHYRHYDIPALEIIEPRAGQVCDSAFQHAEFIADQPFEKYIEQYPNIVWDTSSLNRDEFAHLKLNFPNGLTLKFLKKPILELVSRT